MYPSLGFIRFWNSKFPYSWSKVLLLKHIYSSVALKTWYNQAYSEGGFEDCGVRVRR